MEALEKTIWPLIACFKFLLETLHSITGDYGFAIILLSVCFSTVLMPIAKLVSKLEQKSKAAHDAMEPLIRKVRESYTGRERFERIDEIYNAHNYHPIKSMVSILPLLIQLPFLIAALLVLSNYGPLKEQSFFLVKDLSLPDAMVRFSIASVNLLPILVIIVSLFDSYIRVESTPESKKQFLIVCTVLALLIYQVPAAVCLYWLTTNLYSLARSAYHRYISARDPLKPEYGRENFKAVNWINNCFDKKSLFLLTLYPTLIIPISTYFASKSSYDISAFAVIGFFLLFSLIFGSVFTIAIGFLSKKWTEVLFCLAIFLCLVIFFNYNFHQYNGKVIGADTDIFSSGTNHYDFIVYGFLALLVFVANRKISADRDSIAFFFIAGNLAITATLVIGSLGHAKTETTNAKNVYWREFYELSSEQNVIHILLDGFQGTLFLKIINENPSLKAKFDGFTFYPDALSSSEVTYLSVPSILSGRHFDGTENISKYFARVNFSDDSNTGTSVTPPLLSALHSKGYRLDILADTGSGMPNSKDYSFYANTILPENRPAYWLAQITDISLVKSFPWAAKKHIYRNGNWFLTRFFTENLTSRANQAMSFIREFGSHAKPTQPKPIYKFIHLLTPHGPWTTNKDCKQTEAREDANAVYHQARCSIFALADMLESIRNLGIYDKSVILIHGDHGIAHTYGLPKKSESAYFPMYLGNANPLVLLKPLLSKDHLQISDKQVELVDIPTTIVNLLSIENNFPGVSMVSPSKEFIRQRFFFEFEPNRQEAGQLDRVSIARKFTVSGSIFNPESWGMSSLSNALEINKFATENFISIVRSGINLNNYMWMQYEGSTPRKGIIVVIDDQQVPVIIDKAKKVLVFQIGKARPSANKIYLVNPALQKRQLIQGMPT